MDKLKKSQVNHLIQSLFEDYGTDLNHLKKFYFYIAGRGRVFISNNDIDTLPVKKIVTTGLYFGTYHDENRFRPSIEGSRLINPKKNFLTINKETLKSYISGENLFKEEVDDSNITNYSPFYIVLYENTPVGATSFKEGYYLNYVSKGRKLDFNKLF